MADIDTLTDRLRKASRQIHSLSDALVNARLVVAFTSQRRYGEALSYFYHIHKAIEAHVERNATVSVLQPLAALLPRIGRSIAFQQDLTFLLGPNWERQVSKPIAVVQYLLRLEQISASEPELLLAHAYTQTSALMAGGAIIRRTARKAMKLPDNRGTAVFEFKESPNKLRSELNAIVNAAPSQLSQQQQDALVAEHVRVFELNNLVVAGFEVRWTEYPLALSRAVPLRIQLAFVAVAAGLISWAAVRVLPVLWDRIQSWLL